MAPGICACGCGEATTVHRGVPRRFIRGHHPRGTAKREWHEEDRGYETSCWIWDGPMSAATGYGKTSRIGSSKTLSAHRWSYEEHVGPVPEGMFIDHLCRVRKCMNPDHLEPVTHAENCRRGANAKLTAEQVAEIRSLVGQGWLQRDIAASYGISRPTVSDINRGHSWRAEPSVC